MKAHLAALQPQPLIDCEINASRNFKELLFGSLLFNSHKKTFLFRSGKDLSNGALGLEIDGKMIPQCPFKVTDCLREKID